MGSSPCVTGIVVFIGLCLIIGVPTLVIYGAVVGHGYKNPTFALDRVSVTGFNLTSDGHLTAFFDVVIKIDNQRNHKYKLSFRDVRVSIFKDKQNLAEDALSSFKQPKRNVTFLRAQPVANNVGLKKGPVFDFGLESGMGYVDFDVFMTAGLNGDNLELNCRHVEVNVTSPTTTGFVAGAPFSINDDNPRKFRSVGCSVRIYNNNDNDA